MICLIKRLLYLGLPRWQGVTAGERSGMLRRVGYPVQFGLHTSHSTQEAGLQAPQDPITPEQAALETAQLDFETALHELEDLVAKMEEGELPLEQSLAAYQRGVDLVRICQDRLAKAEQQVRVLEGELLKPFNDAE